MTDELDAATALFVEAHRRYQAAQRLYQADLRRRCEELEAELRAGE